MSPFKIEDNDESFSTNQSIWMETDIDAIVAGIAADGVLAGCVATAQGTPDMTVAVAAGEILVGGVKALVAAGNVTITTADATNPRIDLVVVNNAGAKSVTAGTAAANPKAPDIPASSVLLAMVYVPAGDTTIATNQITDKRVLLRPVVPEGRPSVSSTPRLSVHGVEPSTVATALMTANRVYYEPRLLTTPITLDQLLVEVTTAGAGATTIRLGIYHADADWQPTSLVLDAGTVAADSTGVKTLSISQALQPGRYLFTRNSDGGPTLRVVRGGTRYAGYVTALGATPFVESFYAAQTYAAFPSTGLAWATSSSASTPLLNGIFSRVATP